MRITLYFNPLNCSRDVEFLQFDSSAPLERKAPAWLSSLRQLHRVVDSPEMQEEQPWLLVEHVTVPIIRDDLAAGGHRPQRDRLLAYFLDGSGFPLRSGGEKFRRLHPQRLQRPECFAPRQPQRFIH